MKFGKVGQVGLVSAIALLVATLFTACGTLTVGFLYVATTRQTPGQIEVYEVDSESGSLRTIPTSPFPSGGRDPIAEAASPDSLNLYVANQDDNNIVQFGIGTDGKLYPQSTINTPGSFPLAVAVNSANTFAYSLDTLEPLAGCSLDNPCPGAIAGYAITSAKTAATAGSFGEGSLGQVCAQESSSSTPTCTLGHALANSNGLSYLPLVLSSNNTTVLTPTAMNVTANGQFIYAAAYNATTKQGYLFGFSAGADGSLTPITLAPAASSGAQQIPLSIGSQPVALTSDPTSKSLYLVDKVTNELVSFAIQSDGTLSQTGLVPTGNQPSALAFNNGFLYVTNSLDSTVGAYTIGSNGAAATLEITDSSSHTQSPALYASDADPVAILPDPRGIGFIYTVNFLGNSLSGFQINKTAGTLINARNTPYVSSVQPTALAGIPHGGKTTHSSTTASQ